MKINWRSRVAVPIVLSLVLFIGSLPLRAQDDATDEEDEARWLSLYAEIGVWVSQAAGLEYNPVTIADPDDPFGTQLRTYEHGTETQARYRLGAELKGNRGAFELTWYAQDETVGLSRLEPGNYIFGELLANPIYAGFRNDGLADGFRAESTTTLRDLRIDFLRTAIDTPRVKARWFAGYRRVSHNRFQKAEYFAIINDLPPLIPPLSEPRPDLLPQPDNALLSSIYTGRGIEAGMEFDLPLWKDRIWLEADFMGAVMRGKVSSRYESTTWLYTQNGVTLLPSELGPAIENSPGTVEQTFFQTGVHTDRISAAGEILEASLGFRVRLWRQLELFGGFRAAHYTNVGLDLKVLDSTFLAGVNLQDVDETDRSATYEGFYGGLSYRY